MLHTACSSGTVNPYIYFNEPRCVRVCMCVRVWARAFVAKVPIKAMGVSAS